MNAVTRPLSTRDRLLFILKSREAAWDGYSSGAYTGYPSSGLRNSTSFIVGMLTSLGIEAEMVEVADNNGIDAEVTRFQPTHAIVEAFWVVPEKFDTLIPLHPDVRWIVRNHSEMPFLANEGIAFQWIAGYLKRGIEVMCNAPRAVADVRSVAVAFGLHDRLVSYGPNYYPVHAAGPVVPHVNDGITYDVSCFGAIRPLKNQIVQAIAAIFFARVMRANLRFHVNGGRIEGGGDPILKNIRALFPAGSRYELIEHPWLPHDQFVALSGQMDVALQVSFSETFNIVAADAVSANVPVIVSREIPWIGDYAHADPTSVLSITNAMLAIVSDRDPMQRLHRQRRDLATYCTQTETVWTERFDIAAPSYSPTF